MQIKTKEEMWRTCIWKLSIITMKTKNKQAAMIGTLTKYRNMFLFHLG